MAPTPDALMEFFDGDGDGKITEDEFMAALEELAEEKGQKLCPGKTAKLMDEFKKHDTNDDGMVSLHELEQAIGRLVWN